MLDSRSEREHMIVFIQYADMRWGIPSKASNTLSTVDMCLQELDACCQLSMGTNCVVS
jgi:hypothetical protein